MNRSSTSRKTRWIVVCLLILLLVLLWSRSPTAENVSPILPQNQSTISIQPTQIPTKYTSTEATLDKFFELSKLFNITNTTKRNHYNFSSFGQLLDIKPIASLEIINYEFLDLDPAMRDTKSSCHHNKTTHSVKCLAFSNITNTKSTKYSIVIVVDSLNFDNLPPHMAPLTNTPLKLFQKLPGIPEKNKKYSIETRISVMSAPVEEVVKFINGILGWETNYTDDDFKESLFTKKRKPRKDIIFCGYDVGDHTDLVQEALERKGVTIIPRYSASDIFKGGKFNPDNFPRYLASFRGRCTSEVARANLAVTFRSRKYENEVIVEWIPDEGEDDKCPKHSLHRKTNDSNPISYYDLITESKFCFVPRGHQRWTFRLIEVLSRGCIPVFIADPFHPYPYSGIIPWDKISITIPQDLFRNNTLVVEFLSSVPDRIIKSTREAIYNIFVEYLSTDEKLAILLLHSLLLEMKSLNEEV